MWQPIISGELREQVVTVMNEIVEALPDPSSSAGLGGSLAGGTAGLAVLCAYLARAEYDDYENAAQFLDVASRAVATQDTTVALPELPGRPLTSMNYLNLTMTQTRRSMKYYRAIWTSRHG